MGFTGLARWVNAPTTGLDLVRQNVIRNHGGVDRGKWLLSVRSYRSVFSTARGIQFNTDRTMCALTMNNSVFVLLEDPVAPTRADFLQAQAQAQAAANPPNADTSSGHAHSHHTQLSEPPHYRHTFLTLSPPGALEQLLAQLRARWLSTRQSSTTTTRTQVPGIGQHLVIDGFIFSIGTDWLVRVGNVILAGGAVKGMLLEAEYLPLPVMHLQTADGTSELLSNLLTSILPNIPNARTHAVTISDAQWEEVLWNRSEPDDAEQPVVNKDNRMSVDGEAGGATNGDVFIYDDDDDDLEKRYKGDWVGMDRDRRSAFLIIGALKSEGIL